MTRATLERVATEGRAYRGVSAADRVAERERKLLDAGLELFGTRGVAEVSVGDVCAEAGLTKRYFYELYDDMAAFVDAVMTDVIDGLAQSVLSVESPDAGHRAWVKGFVDAITSDPRLGRLILVETFGAAGSLGRLRQTVMHAGVEVMLSRFVAPEVVANADPHQVRLTAFAMQGAVTGLLVSWLEGDTEASADEIVDFMEKLMTITPGLMSP